ncbi:hypothetical protein B0O80DRAFT_436980 [Mortierella sp. GBAus27b]|nr:hypothetical protein B0O80DRAFT_436980 [Mortierella sp. GBAus27b]
MGSQNAAQPLQYAQAQQPQPAATMVQNPGQGLPGGPASQLNSNTIALLPPSAPTGAGMTVTTGQPFVSTVQQPSSATVAASPTEQKPSSLQILRQQQLEKEREREREKEKEKQQQQQSSSPAQGTFIALVQPTAAMLSGAEPPNTGSSIPFGNSQAATGGNSVSTLETATQGMKPDAIKVEEESMMPPPPPPSHAGVTTRGQESNTAPSLAAAPVARSEEPDVKSESRSATPSSSKAGTSAGPGPSGAAQIFKATYSGVPVFEMICKDVAVMRRRSDSYLNATQILKVADFDKPQRTRILEREVQKGEHEKVQGGYGKYQGTWVPFERGIQLCQEYNVVHLLQPLLDYNTTQASPPLAPKHITAASNRPRKPREPRATGEASSDPTKQRMKPRTKKMKLKGANAQILPKPMGSSMGMESGAGEDGDTSMLATEDDDDGDEDATSTSADDDAEDSDVSMDETMSIVSDQSRTHTRSLSPMGSRREISSDEGSDREMSYSSASTSTSPAGRRRHQRILQDKSPSSLRKRIARPGDELFLGYGENKQRGPRKKRNAQKSNTGDDVEMESGSHLEDNDDHEDDGMDVDDSISFRRDLSPSVRSKASRRSASRTRISDQEDRKSTASSTVATATTSLGTVSRGPYAETLLEYFISDEEALPKVLKDPPADVDFNVVIDDEGHTALHWAAAMAKVDVVKILIQYGADTYKVNTDGQTALMRSVLFSNNYDLKSFPVLLELLQKTIFTIDKEDQTVFHHVANTAGQRGKVHAARYYLECLLEKLAQHPSELASIINVQDRVGDTALTIAARLRVGGKKVVKMLVDAGADLKIRTRVGKNAEEYLLETGQAESTLAPGSSSQHPVHPHAKTGDTTSAASAADGSRLQGATKILQPGSSQQSPNVLSSRRSNPIDSRGPNQTPGPRDAVPGQPLAPPPIALLPPHQMGSKLTTSAGTLYAQLQQANSTWIPTAPAQLPGGAPVAATSQAVIPTVSNLFSRLTQSYERDIFEKDQDILEARNMLHGIQTEIREGHQTIHELKLKTTALGQAEEQIRTLEGLIKQEIHTRQRLRLEELITQEEDVLRKDTEVNGADNGVANGQIGDKALNGNDDVQMNETEPTTTTSAADGSAPIPAEPVNTTTAPPTGAAMESSATNGDPTAATGVPVPGEQVPTSNENPTSTATLPSSDNTPATTTSSTSSSSTKLQSLETEVEELQSKLSQLQQQRKDRVNQIVQLKSTQGKRWYEYQRLIALCCNVSVDQVDDLLDPLLNSLAGKDVEV